MNASPLDMLGVVVSNPTSSPSGGSSSTAFEDSSKKIRKPYTITKSRESWTEQEHDKFLEALQLFDRDWKKIEAFVGSKTVIQIRSHAQKYFLKVQKNGTGERVPPPRPKRKSVQPYPQKVTKSAISSAGDWFHHTLACSNKDPIGNDLGQINTVVRGNYASNGNSSVNISHQALLSSQTTQESCTRVTPDFAEIYKFLGNVFDPNESGHLRKLKEMVPIDRETILLLMGNLSINLSNPKFEEQNLFLPMYDMSSMDPNSTATLVANKTVLLKGPAMTGCMSQSVPVVHSSPAEAALETSHQVQLLETIPESTLELAQGSQLMSSNSLVATDLRNVESPFVIVPSSSQLPTGPVNTLSFLPNGQNAIMESESEFTLGCKLLPSGGTRRETVDGWWG